MTCLITGLDTTGIASGVVANLQLTLAASATTTSIGIISPLGANATGSRIASLAATNGVVTIPALSSVTCNSGSLSGGGTSTCTVTISPAAPGGGSTVTLSSNNTLLAVPASVTVPAGATTATFTGTAAATISTDQSGTVTATLGASSQAAAIGLQAPVLVSGVACNPTSLSQSGTSACAVTLTQTAPTGGSTIALSSNDMLLNVPSSVTVPAGSTTATFTATAGATIASNQSATVTAALGSSSQTAAIGLLATSVASDESFLVRYAANLNVGESYIDITNTGANGAALLGPGFGTATGNICVNVYAFDPGEELIACCSCLVTPDQTVDLGVNRDLAVKTLTGVVPTSLTVKLLITLAGGDGTGAGCTNSAAMVANATLAAGSAAWGTTIHAGPSAGTYLTTETPFTPSALGAGELASIAGRCTSILGNGSGFGVCNSCRASALGGSNLPQ